LTSVSCALLQDALPDVTNAERSVAKNHIQHFPKPLLDDLVNGRWLPVIGAGMSLNATLAPPAKMPLWGDLGKYFADELKDYSPTGVLDAISAYEHEFGRVRLIERLGELLHLDKVQPGPAHREFCSLPFDIVCTTNFDFLLEKQYGLERQDHRTIHPVVDEDQLSINIGAAGTLLLKLHGDLRHPKRLVVTEEDYDGFLSNYPLIATYLSNQLITKTAVFVGYSLDDPDFRQIWHVVSNRLGKARHMAYAILVNASPGDIARFERRKVKVVNLPGSRERYGHILAEAFAELREYRRERAGPTLKPTEERPLEQLLLPRDAMTRLCFFALPLDVLPFYRERIFPLAEDVGFVPVTAADVINLGDSVSAKIDTLIDRAAVMVVDLSSEWTRFEFGMALARAQEISSRPNRRTLQLIPIVTQFTELPISAQGFLVIKRPDLLSEDSEQFVQELAQTFRHLSNDMGVAQNLEPRRLFEAREYRAAVIAAMTLLEATLRQRLNKSPWGEAQRPLLLRQLLNRAAEANILPNAREEILNWTKLRNKAVHTADSVSRNEAKAVVEGVERILGIVPH
jgi:hypothetical protein